MLRSESSIPLIRSLSEVAADYDALVVDVWGVLHNGVAAFPGAPEALAAFRATGRPVVLLSNAPRPSSPYIVEQLARLSIAEGRDFDAIVTSGDLARKLVSDNIALPLLHIGPERDRPLFDNLPVTFAEAPAAGIVVCSGLFDDTREGPEDYRSLLSDLARRAVPMVCANPDLTVERGGQIIYCAGALAALYRELGGSVTYAGKPYPPVYDLVFARLAALAGRSLDRRRVLAVGDGLRTDIAGAHAVGLPALFVASAIHVDGDLDEAGLAALFPDQTGPRPVAAMAGLRW